MENIEKLELTAINMENLEVYSQMLHITPNTIINVALEQYFNNLHKTQGDENHNTNLDYDEFVALEQYFNNLHKTQGDENHNTNLDYDEFWDGVEL